MAQESTLSVRIDKEDKKNFETFCSETGMNVSVAINMFVKDVIREQRLPFEVAADPFYSKTNIARLKKSAAEMARTGGTIHEVMDE
ncbi:MAG: type II toxin-antitoxin system RelB/DinJ family antitoxin [Lachnospiraceae bacterium]|jgi:DNA-damage-inducible protein J|nr:type II toxin-antitoxin system RelB/DinJ family antitoxin [Lachnospiraceae bacterium]MCI1726275.1 type II toxin-antitoxin system RelB/DinJ family antitoxin [Lachnospiraceae bacterium]